MGLFSLLLLPGLGGINGLELFDTDCRLRTLRERRARLLCFCVGAEKLTHSCDLQEIVFSRPRALDGCACVLCSSWEA